MYSNKGHCLILDHGKKKNCIAFIIPRTTSIPAQAFYTLSSNRNKCVSVKKFLNIQETHQRIITYYVFRD